MSQAIFCSYRVPIYFSECDKTKIFSRNTFRYHSNCQNLIQTCSSWPANDLFYDPPFSLSCTKSFIGDLAYVPGRESGMRVAVKSFKSFLWRSEGQGCHYSAKKTKIMPKSPANDVRKMMQIRIFSLTCGFIASIKQIFQQHQQQNFLLRLRYLNKLEKKKKLGKTDVETTNVEIQALSLWTSFV